MYFVFKHEIKSWRNYIIMAEIVGNLPSYQPHWWYCEPVTPPLPRVQFAISGKAPLPDNLPSGTEFELYSPRLMNLMDEGGVRFERFSTVMLDRKTKVELPVQYKIFHLLECYPALDREQSVRLQYGWQKIVLTEDCYRANRLLFRVEEARGIVLIHEDLKACLEDAGITGCTYRPLER
jgi:hypothetical protein